MTIAITAITEQIIENQKQSIIDQKKITAGALANRFEHRLDDAAKVVEIAARSPEFSSLPYAHEPSTEFMGVAPQLEQDRKTIVRNILYEYENFETLAFVLPNGDIYFVEPYESQIALTRLNFADREWYQGTLETGETYTADVLMSAATSNRVIPISTPVYASDGSLSGMLVAAVNLGKLEQELVAELDLTNNNRVIYVDDNGNIIQDIRSSGMTNPDRLEFAGNIDAVSAVLDGESGYSFTTMDSEETLLVYHPIVIGVEEWGLVLAQPTEDAFKALDQFRSESYVLVIVLGAILGAAGYFLINFRKNSGITKQLTRANVELTQKDKLKDEFIKIASHELRTPIQPILGYSSLGVRGLVKDNSAWKVVYSEAQRLMRLSNNIIDISMVQSGVLAYNMQKTNIFDVIQSAIRSFKAAANEKGLSLDLMTDEKFKNVDIDGDGLRLKQVFDELLDNAIKFTQTGGVRVECQTMTDSLTIRVVDSGTAIPTEILPRLFELFSSKSVSDATAQGAGLGLFINKAIINAHGGTIVANNNTDGPGCTFELTFPMQPLREFSPSTQVALS